jgi:hypothetical protein
VFSKENLFQVYQAQIGVPNQYQPVPTSCGRGLFAPWAFAANRNTPDICFLAKDGIYRTSGGPAVSITEDDLDPIFHGQTVETYQPIDFTQTTKLRMWFFDQEYYFQYQDTQGNVQVLAYHTLKNRWRHANYPFGPACGFAQPEVGNVLLFGGNNALVFKEDNTLATDDGVAIAFHLRTGAYDMGDEFREKEFGNILLGADPGGATITVAVLYDWEQTTEIPVGSPITGVGRQSFPLPLGDSYGRNALLDIQGTASVVVTLFGMKFLWRPDEDILRHWESPESSFGVDGYFHVYQGRVGYRSDGTVLVRLIGDGVTFGPYTLPSTGGLRQSARIDVDINKQRLLRVKADLGTATGFRLYREDSFLQLAPWQGGQYAEVPFIGGT